MLRCDFCEAMVEEVYVTEWAGVQVEICKPCALNMAKDEALEGADVDARAEALADAEWENSEECHNLDLRS